MSFAATAAAAITAGSAIYMGAQQRKKAKAIRDQAVDPGIQPDQSLSRVTNTLYDRYNNYQLPGYNAYVDQIRGNAAFAHNQAVQGATSSGDVIDSASRSQLMADQSLNNLALQNAGSREAALMQYLDSVRAQGQDGVRVNQMELGRYDRTLAEAAALEGAGTQNMYQGIQDAGIGATALAQSFMPRTSINPNTGETVQLPSIWSMYRNQNRNRRGNGTSGNSMQDFWDANKNRPW